MNKLKDNFYNHDRCPEDGYWLPMSSSDPSDEKYLKKGQYFPLYKGMKTTWKLVRR